MRENLVETEGVKHAIKRGCQVRKWSSPGQKGILDRLHFIKSFTFAIEYKSTGKKATPKQRAEAAKLKAAGIPARCIDNVQDAREFIDLMVSAANGDSPLLDMAVLSNDIRSFDP